MSSGANEELDRRILELGLSAKVLDVGGWAQPYPLATHVVDLMSYETRREAIGPYAERFAQESWVQADVSEPTFKLPFCDDYFAFALCRHTLEDLHEVRGVLRECGRVAKRGYVECPSRLMEQTRGVRDRCSFLCGFNHHKWVVDLDPDGLVFWDKSESFFQPPAHYAVPLWYYERRTQTSERLVQYYWDEVPRFRIVLDGNAARQRARDFRAALHVPPAVDWLDRGLLVGRRLRHLASGKSLWPTVVTE